MNYDLYQASVRTDTLDVAELLKLELRTRVEKEVEKKVQEKPGDELQKLLKIN